MKSIHRLIVLSFTFFTFSLQAQHPSVVDKAMTMVNNFPDSIRIELPDQKAIILFELKNIKYNTEAMVEFSDNIKKIREYIINSVTDVSIPHQVTIVEKENEEQDITIIRLDAQKITLKVKDNEIQELLPAGWELTWISNKSKTHLYIHSFNDLEAIAKLDIKALTNKLKPEARQPFVGRKRMIARSIIKNNETVFQDIKFQMPEDFLGIHAGVGFGFLQNRFYPELNVSLAVYRGNHFNTLRQKIGLDMQTLFLSTTLDDGTITTDKNTFLSLTYGWNFAQANNRQRWSTFGAGLLVNRSGDYFTGKTAKFFFKTDIGSSKLNMVPELYLTNDFKKTLFGIKLNYVF